MSPRLTYANIASTLAVVLALGGGGAAFATSLADDSVGSRHLQDRSIRAVDVKKGSLGSRLIRNGSIRAVDVKGESLGTQQIADGSLLGLDLKPRTLTGDLLANGTLLGAHLKDGTLTGDQVANGTLTGTDLADGSIGSDQVRNGTLTGSHVADDSLTGDDIDESTLDLDLPPATAGTIVASTPSGQTVLTAGANPMGSVVLDAPSAGMAMVIFQAEFNATAGSRYLSVAPTRNGNPMGFYDWDAGDIDGFFDHRQTGFAVVPVAAGQHTFAFSATEERTSGTYTSYYGAQIAVHFVPTATAAPALPSRRQAPPNR